MQPGIEKKWYSLGKTTIFGEYRHDDPGANIDGKNAAKTLGADLTFWSAGIIQGIEAADMIVYAMYRNSDGEYTTGAGDLVKLDDFQMFVTGAKINF